MMRSLPLRRRMTIAVALAVAVAVALAAAVAYLAVRGELLSEVDRALEDQLTFGAASARPRRGGPPRFGPLPARRGGPTPYIQVIDTERRTSSARSGPSAASCRSTSGRATWPPASGREYFSDATSAGTHVRVLRRGAERVHGSPRSARSSSGARWRAPTPCSRACG